MVVPYIPYDGPVVTRDEAKAAGLKRFFTGKPCKRQHLAERYARCCTCLACCYEQATQWRNDNPDKRKTIKAASYLRHKDAVAASGRAYYLKNKVARLAYSAAYAKANKARRRITYRLWAAATPGRSAFYAHTRRARKAQVGGSYTLAQIKSLAVRQGHKCLNCRTSIKAGYHVDHVLPLVLGGSNNISNLQLLCAACNLGKSRKDPIVWAQQNGRLL